MKHDTQKYREEMVEMLKELGIYDPMLSGHEMVLLHEFYYRLKDKGMIKSD